MSELHGGGGMAAQHFEEEEAWGVMKTTNSTPIIRNKLPTSSSSSVWTSRPANFHQSSAPLDIPDCSKIFKEKRIMWGDGEDDEMIPPHEYLARRLANTQVASFSMCEGIGRTLKGRDLTNLRKAILTKTGFLE